MLPSGLIVIGPRNDRLHEALLLLMSAQALSEDRTIVIFDDPAPKLAEEDLSVLKPMELPQLKEIAPLKHSPLKLGESGAWYEPALKRRKK